MSEYRHPHCPPPHLRSGRRTEFEYYLGEESMRPRSQWDDRVHTRDGVNLPPIRRGRADDRERPEKGIGEKLKHAFSSSYKEMDKDMGTFLRYCFNYKKAVANENRTKKSSHQNPNNRPRPTIYNNNFYDYSNNTSNSNNNNTHTNNHGNQHYSFGGNSNGSGTMSVGPVDFGNTPCQ